MIGKSKNQIRQRALEAIREQQQKAQMQAMLLGTTVERYPDPEEIMAQMERATQTREDTERARREDREREMIAQIRENARRNLNMDWGLNGAFDIPDGFRAVYGSRGAHMQRQLEQEYEQRREQERQAHIQRLREAYSTGWWDEVGAVEQEMPTVSAAPAIAPKPKPVVKVIRGARRIRV